MNFLSPKTLPQNLSSSDYPAADIRAFNPQASRHNYPGRSRRARNALNGGVIIAGARYAIDALAWVQLKHLSHTHISHYNTGEPPPRPPEARYTQQRYRNKEQKELLKEEDLRKYKVREQKPLESEDPPKNKYHKKHKEDTGAETTTMITESHSHYENQIFITGDQGRE
ncbi:unnamed protein product [Linum trigynum]|uniref:Uncharacterized protein n=1 Tax=Linum trigynum TaxID=586398 RepID=A0AAV2GAN6_9ROSI